MKTTHYIPLTALATSIISVALATSALAAKGGEKGKPDGGDGGGDGSGGTNPPKKAPITYTQTQLRWHEDADPAFGGLYVETVNRQGLVVGWVKRPNGFIHGVVNIDSNGNATDSMVDLNDLLASSLETVAPGWRIAYGRTINDNRLIGCSLVPDDVAEKDSSSIPVKLAVADLGSLALTLVDPGVTDPKSLILEMNQHGDLLVARGVAFVEDGYNRWDNTVYANTPSASGLPSYSAIPLPEVTEYRPSMNAALQIASVTYGKPDFQRRYDLADSSATTETWSARRKDRAYTGGIAADGTVYVNKSPGSVYRITVSPSGEVTPTPLSDESAGLPGYRNKVSAAQQPGEEEMVLRTTVLEVYKPNYGRFPFPATLQGTIDNVNISPPHDPSSEQSYIGGYIVFEDRQDITHSFILTPEGATPPLAVTQP